MSISGSGVVYIAWGQTHCPSTDGTELILQGLAATAVKSDFGSGSNYLCLSEDSLSFKPVVHSDTYQNGSVVGVKYVTANESLQELNGTGMPCSVCYTTRATQLVIPGRAVCPGGWRVEYIGYLMSSGDTPSETLSDDQSNYNFRNKYICVSGESVPRPVSNRAATVYHVYLDCRIGASLECIGSSNTSQLTCAVCTLDI